MSNGEADSSMQQGVSCDPLGAFFGGFFLAPGVDVSQEPLQGLAVPLVWGGWLSEAAGSCSNRIARRKSIIRSVQKNITCLGAALRGCSVCVTAWFSQLRCKVFVLRCHQGLRSVKEPNQTTWYKTIWVKNVRRA